MLRFCERIRKKKADWESEDDGNEKEYDDFKDCYSDMCIPDCFSSDQRVYWLYKFKIDMGHNGSLHCRIQHSSLCGSCMGTKKENVSCGRIKMRFKYTDGGNADFITLCHELDEFLNEIAGGEENRAEYIPYNQLNDIQDVIVAYDNELPVGSASFKKYDNECAEIKRVFVKKEYRGKGISKSLMELLENRAREQGYHYLILESGEPLTAAMALYKKIGYTIAPNYGPYQDMPESICMKKKI